MAYFPHLPLVKYRRSYRQRSWTYLDQVPHSNALPTATSMLCAEPRGRAPSSGPGSALAGRSNDTMEGRYGGGNAYAPFRQAWERQIFHVHVQPQATISFFELDDIGCFIDRCSAAPNLLAGARQTISSNRHQHLEADSEGSVTILAGDDLEAFRSEMVPNPQALYTL